MAIQFNVPGIQALTNALNNFKVASSNSVNGVPVGASSPIGGKAHQQYLQNQIQNLNRQIASGGGNSSVYNQLTNNRRRLAAMQQIAPSNGFTSTGAGFRVIGAMIRSLAAQSPYAVGLMASIIGTTGPLGIALGALTVGILAAVASFKFLENYVGGFGTRQTSTYATNSQQATLDAIANAIGVDKSAFSNTASSMPNGAKQMIDLINAYMGMGNTPASQRWLKTMNLPPELSKLFDLTDDQRKRAFSGENTMVSKQDVKTINQVTAAWNEMVAVMQNKLYKSLMYLIDIFKLIDKYTPKGFTSTPLDTAGKLWDKISSWFSGIAPKGFVPTGMSGKHRTTPYDDPKTPNEIAWNKALKDIENGVNAASKRMDNAANTFSNAVDAFSYTAKSGIFGGIDTERGKKAFPSNWAWSWQQLDQLNQNDMMLTGAFTL